MDISKNFSKSLFNTELESYLSRLILSDTIGMMAHAVLGTLFIMSGAWRLSIIFVVLISLSLISLQKTKALKTEMLDYTDDLDGSVEKWKSYYLNFKKSWQLVTICIIPLLIICNLLAGMTFQDMMHDAYTIILIPFLLIISLLMFSKGFPSLTYVLKLAIDY